MTEHIDRTGSKIECQWVEPTPPFFFFLHTKENSLWKISSTPPFNVTLTKCFQVKKLNSRRVLFLSSTLANPFTVHLRVTEHEPKSRLKLSSRFHRHWYFLSLFHRRQKNSSLGSCRLAGESSVQRVACISIAGRSKQAV